LDPGATDDEEVRIVHVIDEPLPDAKVIGLQPHGDDRGRFTETFNRAKLAPFGIDHEFVQDNESLSVHRHTIRGLHLQLEPHAQGKFVRVLTGSIVDVAVDIRPGSETYRQHCIVELSSADDLAFWIPPGFAHGFCTLEDNTTLAYKVTAPYEPTADRSIRWDDPDLAIGWPTSATDAVLSTKDASAPSFADIEQELS
jgi:dTDP-4-dehydrorhamnose 3,5-epimerase